MLTTPWICRNCLSRVTRPLIRRSIRHQSTGERLWHAKLEFSLTTRIATLENVPKALLARARDVALEHKQLTDKLATGFDTRAAKKLGEYSPIVNALGQWDRASEVSNPQSITGRNDQSC